MKLLLASLFITCAVFAETVAEKAETEFKASVSAARKVLVAKLTAEMAVLTKKGDLDGALKLREMIKSYDVAGETVALPAKGDLIDLSKTATYKTSSCYLRSKTSPNLLNGIGGGCLVPNGEKSPDLYAFHTNSEKNPFIIIDLGQVCAISKITVVNSKFAPERAKNLTVSVSLSDKGPWEDVWKADDHKPEWNIETHQTTRFVKLWLNDTAYFHLYSVQIR